jgi:hypothetical protein
MVAIGGVGGSGTRVIAQILQESGFFTGYDLNESNDTLLFTLLFKRQDILTLSDSEFDDTLNIFTKIMSSKEALTQKEQSTLSTLASKDRTLHDKEWLQGRLNFISHREVHNNWGWKEPNTHIIIEKLLKRMDNLKFVYVYRNGLDMAYSDNQNQLKLWGPLFLNDYNLEINPKNSLKYWCITHKRMLHLKNTFQERIFMLDFDKLCNNPKDILVDFAKFINYKKDILTYTSLIKVPKSIGRHKSHPLDDFDKEDLDFLHDVYDV